MSKSNGYTLIEVLIALFIFSIATYLAGVSIIESQRYEKVIKERTKRLVHVQRAMTLMAQDVVQAVAKTKQRDGQMAGSFFTEDNRLFFTRMGQINPDFNKNESSLKDVILYLENENIIRETKTVEADQYTKSVLLKEVTSLEWLFYDQQLKEYNIWPPTQDWLYKIPRLISLRVTLPNYGTIERTIALSGETIKYDIPVEAQDESDTPQT